MAYRNSQEIIGNLGRDVELHYSQQGEVVGKFSVGVNSPFSKNEHTEWFRVVVFGRNAERCAQFLEKGSMVFIEGETRTNKWTDRDGNDRYTTELIANDVQFLDGRGRGNHNGNGASHRSNGFPNGAEQPALDYPPAFVSDGTELEPAS